MALTLREPVFGERTRPTRQHPLRVVKGKPTQDRWIVLVAWDHCWSLRSYSYHDGALQLQDGRDDTMDYSELWSALSSFDLCGRKTWLIGWRVRYAIEKAGFCEALERGDVALPKVKVGENKGKHGGKLTWNRRLLEVDVVAGRNKIKLLDWSNFGVDPGQYVARLDDVTPEIAETALQDFLGMADANKIAVCKSTAAQLGWDHCRRITQDLPLHVNLSSESRAMERRAYHGGRCEAFRLGDIPGTTYSLDVKSCYASICRDLAMPCRMIEEYKSGVDVETIKVFQCDHWIADVVIQTDEPDYPLQWRGSPIYPVGEFATALPWPELLHAIKRGRVIRVLRAARYEAEPILRDYAEWYFMARELHAKLGNGKMSGALKAMFNASLGYTARQRYDWQPWDSKIAFPYWFGSALDPETLSQCVSAQVLGNEKRWLKVAGEPYEAMPFLHATIASYARVKLLEVFAVAGRENILYCDTDGILCTRAGREVLESYLGMTGAMPGQLVERFVPGSARIQGQKNYRIGDQWIQAGTVKSRHSLIVAKRVLTTDAGRVMSDGRVEPFRFACEDVGGEVGKWQNVVV